MWSNSLINRCLPPLLAGLLALAAPAALAGPLTLENAWVRALPPTVPNTAAYVEIVNNGGETVTLTGGHSDLGGRLEIHRTREVEGYMRMEQVETLQLAPGERMVLAPGGVHLMLVEVERMPAPGDTVRLCLEVDGDDESCTDAAVRKAAGDDATHQHHHH